jgi:hypothetical protein
MSDEFLFKYVIGAVKLDTANQCGFFKEVVDKIVGQYYNKSKKLSLFIDSTTVETLVSYYI